MQNILLDKNYHIKITDFGSAKIINVEDTPEMSKKRGSFVGTAGIFCTH